MITRKYSILDQSSELEHLHTFKNVPASMACTSQNESQDVSMDQVWDICKNTGMIQLRNLFPLDVAVPDAGPIATTCGTNPPAPADPEEAAVNLP